MLFRCTLIIACSLGAGCSVVASSGEFEFGETCRSDEDCPAGPQALAECVAGSCVTACEEGFGDCDALPSNGCEADLTTSANTCGTCETRCDFAGALAVCSDGTCAIEECLGTTEDCDGDAANGCEANLASPAHCMGCNVACPDALPFCQVEDGSRRCVEECSAGLELCDGMTCADTQSSTAHCGACNRPCEGGNATWLCSGGACEVSECLEGYFDCDGDASNGCEVDGRVDSDNCGGCGTVCVLDNATAACSESSCAIVECDAEYSDCDDDASNGCEIRTATDTRNCNTCGNECTGGEFEWSCNAGVCETGLCLIGRQDCDGDGMTCETDITNSVVHCGMCDMACAAANGSVQCVDRSCEIDSCDGNFRDCDGEYATGCEVDTQNDAAHCGGCNAPCAAGSACVAGTCERRVLGGALGRQHGCAILADSADAGEVYCWGHDGEGTQGQGVANRPASEATPVPDPAGGVFHASSLTAADGTVCAIERSTGVGRVWCWGDGNGRILGRGDTLVDSPEPILVEGDAAFGAADFVQVDAQRFSVCARAASGELWCWGSNTNAKILGVPSGAGSFQDTPLDQGFDGSTPAQSIVDVSVGPNHVCVVLGDATVRCWGATTAHLGDPLAAGPIVQPTGLPSISSVQVDDGHSCALAMDGSLWCWGENPFGELGDGSTATRTTPVQVSGFGPMDPATSLVVGVDHTCAQSMSGVWCWGRASRGGVGNGSLGTPQPLPIRIDSLAGNEALGTAQGLFGAYGSTCALDEGADVPACWGSAAIGALTRGAIVAPSPVGTSAAPLAGVSDIAAGVNAGCATSFGLLYCWGKNVSTPGAGQYITGRPESSATLNHHDPLVVMGINNVVEVEMAREFACALGGTGTVHCWGAGGSSGFLGGLSSTPTPVQLMVGGTASSLAMGDRHACAVYDNMGTPTVSCWGRSAAGQTGQVAGTNHAPLDVALGTCVPTQVAAGGATTCVRCEDGTARCFGEGRNGQLGNGDIVSTEAPTAVMNLSNIVEISVGLEHVCALADEDAIAGNELYCWGSSSRGELGVPAAPSSTTPIVVPGMEGATDVMTGVWTTCAVVGGEVYCWGAGDWGLLGSGAFASDAPFPQRVPLPAGSLVSAVRSGAASSTLHPKTYYAVRTDGSVLAWGWNGDGAAGTSPVYLSTATSIQWSGR